MTTTLNTNSGTSCSQVLVAAPLGASRGAIFFASEPHRFESDGASSRYESDATASELGRPAEGQNVGETAHQIKGIDGSDHRFSGDCAAPANVVKPVEEWRRIPGFVRYEVSSLGRVRSYLRRRGGIGAPKVLSPTTDRIGYRLICISTDAGLRQSFGVHVLVASAFLGKCPDGHEVDHKDFDKSNNAFGNLEYVTHRENMRRAAMAGRMSRKGINLGEDGPSSKLTASEVVAAISLRRSGKTYKQVASALNGKVTWYCVKRICLGQTWSHVTGIKRPASPAHLAPSSEAAR